MKQINKNTSFIKLWQDNCVANSGAIVPRAKDLCRKYFLTVISFSVLLLMVPLAQAEEDHQLVRRIVVFPLDVERTYQKKADNVWWDLRERLSESKRFLIASKNFMETKDVFQARGELEPADAIILGRLLESHAMLTTSLSGRKLTMRAYEGRRGQVLWKQSIELHPSVPVSKQLGESARKLVYDFMASIPYQAFVTVDPLVGKALYLEGDSYRVKIQVGTNSKVQAGEKVQIIDLKNQTLDPGFQGGLVSSVIAEGVVINSKNRIANVQITGLNDQDKIKEGSFVRLPNEYQRMQSAYLLDTKRIQGAELRFVNKNPGLTDKQKERKPLSTAVAFFVNLAMIIAIAF